MENQELKDKYKKLENKINIENKLKENNNQTNGRGKYAKRRFRG